MWVYAQTCTHSSKNALVYSRFVLVCKTERRGAAFRYGRFEPQPLCDCFRAFWPDCSLTAVWLKRCFRRRGSPSTSAKACLRHLAFAFTCCSKDLGLPTHFRKVLVQASRAAQGPRAALACLRAMAVSSGDDVPTQLATLLGKEVVSIRKTSETPPRISVIDVVEAITGQVKSNSGKTLERVKERHPEVYPNWINYRFPGRGQRD